MRTFKPVMLAASFILVSSLAMAQSISVNFHVGGDADAQADHQLTAGETAGLEPVDGAFWNNIDVGAGGAHNDAEAIFASTSLVDNSGASAATIAPSVDSTYFVGYAASAALTAAELGLAGNDDDLFNSYLALNGPNGDGSPADVGILSITGISSTFTSGGYDLIIYSDSDRGSASGADRTSVFTVTPGGGSPITVLAEDDGSLGADATFNNNFVLSDNTDDSDSYSNYILIEGLTADSFDIDVTSPDGGRGAISGFQLVVDFVTGANLPGDVNDDMTVDILDFNIIRDNFRDSVTEFTDGDLTGPSGVRDNVVDFHDYIEWATAFQLAGGSLAGLELNFLQVPEPTSGMIVVLGLLTVVGRRPRK